MTDLTRHVEGINIIISCHGRIGTQQDFQNMNQPDRIQVPANTTFHFYTEPGNYVYCPDAYDIQSRTLCQHIHRHNGHTTDINFSVSTGYIPNFILSVEPNQQTFMSQVVVCDAQGISRVLINMEELQTQGVLSRPLFTLRDILDSIQARGIEDAKLAANDTIHYHCMFCQDGIVPQFWAEARSAAATADAELRRRLGVLRRQMTPLRHRIHPNQVFLTPTGTRRRRISPGSAQELDAYRKAVKSGKFKGQLWTTPEQSQSAMIESTTPLGQGAGQGARQSSLTRTFSSQPVLHSPPRVQRRHSPRVSRWLFPRERRQGRGREVNLTARREDVIRRERRQSRRRREDSLRKRRKK